MIILILLLVAHSYAGDGQYECGPNGRFEYCIDDIPGCVVGCHCYPGYFFDTDTKICEPNTKLTQDFRRHFVIDAGKEATTTEPAASAAPAPAAKDNDDISDWLYNQFFKTIENQVINKTDDDDLIKKGTRRSGGPVYKRKFKKKKRSKKGYKKSSKHELRRKLLRISEDDSMFDSDSNSGSSSGGTSSSSSWESWGSADSGEAPKRPHEDGDHGHRKIVIFSKKPKPPLPSFIFLPNIETPFYPPIGLPMPAMPAPMYPMIPVPPIQPPPQAGSTAPSTSSASSAATRAPATTAATTARGSSAAPTAAPPHTGPTTAASDEKPDEADKVPDKDDDKDPDKEEPKSLRNGRSKLLRGQARSHLLQRIKERRNKARNSNKKEAAAERLSKLQVNNFMEQFGDPADFYQQPILEDNVKHDENEVLPFENDVDFKYLTQLIHRVDLNGTSTPPPVMQFNKNRNGFMGVKRPAPAPRPAALRRVPAPARRSFQAAASQPDDSYYTQLGRDIAELIRDIQPDDVGTIDIDVEHESNGKPSPYFGENSFAPRSYWERFVRSPIKVQLRHFSKYGKIASSNEKLFDLESKVEIAANASPVLSLPELENVIYAMERAQKTQIHNHQSQDTNNNPSQRSLNVSLLPQLKEKKSSASKKNPSPDFEKVLNQHDFRRNNVIKASRVTASDRKQGNHTHTGIKNTFTQHGNSKSGYNIHSSTPTIMRYTIKKSAALSSSKYQSPQAAVPNASNYFPNFYSKINPNFPVMVTKTYRRPYKEPKPSYFFNEFDYFI